MVRYRYEITALLKASKIKYTEAAEICGVTFEVFCAYVNGHIQIPDEVLIHTIRKRLAVMQGGKTRV